MKTQEKTEKKLPPIEKIPEAYSVLADGRIKEVDDNTYLITSSNGEKEYKVTITGNRYRSNDNATKFARYAGYPILAVLMYKHILPQPEEFLHLFAGINWTAINKEYKRDYAAALKAALESKHISAEETSEIYILIKECYDRFCALDIVV